MVGERPPAAAKTATCYAAHCVHAELTGIGLPECVRRVIKQAFKRLTPSLKINADVLDGLNFFFFFTHCVSSPLNFLVVSTCRQ